MPVDNVLGTQKAEEDEKEEEEEEEEEEQNDDLPGDDKASGSDQAPLLEGPPEPSAPVGEPTNHPTNTVPSTDPAHPPAPPAEISQSSDGAEDSSDGSVQSSDSAGSSSDGTAHPPAAPHAADDNDGQPPPAGPQGHQPAPVRSADPVTRKRTLKTVLVTNYTDDKKNEEDRIKRELIRAAAQHAPAAPAGAPGVPGAGPNGGVPGQPGPGAGPNGGVPGQPGPGPGPNGGGQPGQANPPAPSGKMSGLEKYMFGSGIAMDSVNIMLGIGNSAMGFRELYADDKKEDQNSLYLKEEDKKTGEKVPKKITEKEKYKEEDKPAKVANGVISMGMSLWGGVNNAIGIGVNKKKLNTKNKRKKTAAKYGLATNVTGLLANASKVTATGLGTFGDQSDTGTNRATRWIGLTGTALGTLGSAFAWKASSKDKAYRKQITKESGDLARIANRNDQAIDDTKNRMAADDANSDWDTYKTDQEHLNSLKAMKYAMHHANEMNSVRANQSTKGIAGTLGGIVSTLGSLVNAIPPIADTGFGQFVKAASGAIGSLTIATKQYERASDINTRNKIQKKKEELVNEYVQDGIPDLDRDISTFYQQYPQIRNITYLEKKRILIGRLGVDVEINDEAPKNDDVIRAFDKLNHERAMEIKNSEQNVRERILDILCLEHDASVEEIESVLRGD